MNPLQIAGAMALLVVMFVVFAAYTVAGMRVFYRLGSGQTGLVAFGSLVFAAIDVLVIVTLTTTVSVWIVVTPLIAHAGSFVFGTTASST